MQNSCDCYKSLSSKEHKLLRSTSRWFLFRYNIPGHSYRGYGLFTKKLVQKKVVSVYDEEPKCVLFLFGGSESEWTGAGSSLMKIPAFADTIEKCHRFLSKKNIDLVRVVTNSDLQTDPVVNTTAGVAIQLALIDLLRSVNVYPDKFLGISMGEIVCAYVDDCLDLEQAILSSYLIASSRNTRKSRSELLNSLKKIIPSPKPQSNKWLSVAKEPHCSPEFLVLAISSRFVLPDDIPQDSIILEFSPHALSHPSSVPLLKRDEDDVDVFLNGIGQLYLSGCNPRIEHFYPEVAFPVSRGTPMIAPLIRWEHSKNWFVRFYESEERVKIGERTVSFLISDEHSEYISGHVIDGKEEGDE